LSASSTIWSLLSENRQKEYLPQTKWIFLMKLNSKELRKVDPTQSPRPVMSSRQNLFPHTLKTSLTRTTSGIISPRRRLGVAHMFLCGETTPPPNNRIHKASCGTYKSRSWHIAPVADALASIRLGLNDLGESNKLSVVSVEIIHLYSLLRFQSSLPDCSRVGNETTGVTITLLRSVITSLRSRVGVSINRLNVIVSAGIVSYHIASQQM
jgi:hypothetical protein